MSSNYFEGGDAIRSIRALPVAIVALALAVAGAAHAGEPAVDLAPQPPEATRIRAAARLMADLRGVSRRQAAEIRDVYAPEMRALSLKNRGALRDAHQAGKLTGLANLAGAHNIRLRLAGRHPIGELDLDHQHLYLAARPETVGCLLQVASRVRSGPVEVTSLVRHGDYQRALARGNANARTEVPTHAMGLAFDISILHAPRETATEIREVLEHMAADGDLFFIAEQHQLVFHVVPAPDRRDYHAAVAAVMSTVGPPAIAASLPAWFPAPAAVPAPRDDLALAGPGGVDGRDLFEWWPVIVLAVIGLVATARRSRRATS